MSVTSSLAVVFGIVVGVSIILILFWWRNKRLIKRYNKENNNHTLKSEGSDQPNREEVKSNEVLNHDLPSSTPIEIPHGVMK